MSSYTLEDVIKKWEHGKLTTEQAIGQMLLLLQALSQRVGALEKTAVRQRDEGNGK